MAKQTIAVGKRYGRLMILALGERQEVNTYFDRALCECGTVKTVRRADLQSGRITSCGCARRENATKVGAATRTHGRSKDPLYHLWHTMIARCHNPNHVAYRYYGARGINVCERWRASFDAFAADMGARPVGLELDRIDPDGHYEPGNVRWMNRRMQKLTRVRRSDHYTPRAIDWNGSQYAISDLAAIAGISYSTMYERLMKGMTVETAIALPVRQQRERFAQTRTCDKRLSDLPKPHAETCAVCSQPIAAKRSTMKFCSPACRMKAHRQQRKEQQP